MIEQNQIPKYYLEYVLGRNRNENETVQQYFKAFADAMYIKIGFVKFNSIMLPTLRTLFDTNKEYLKAVSNFSETTQWLTTVAYEIKNLDEDWYNNTILDSSL